MSAAGTLLAALAGWLRALPDEELVEIGAGGIVSRLGGSTYAEAATRVDADLAKRAKRPIAKPARRAPKRRGGAPVVEAKKPRAGINESAERVFKALVGCDGSITRPEIVSKTKLADHQVGHALKRLKEEGRAFLAGHSKSSRWAITQEAADEAVGG